jgi:ATP-dependent Clp endopeptidase proteolytic subunit ClpP
MSNVRFVNRGNAGEIWLYDQVGEGMFGGMSAKTFGNELRALGKVGEINLRINSPGGSVFDGVAIYNQLKQHPARIVVDIDGVAASIASVIAMAGDEIRMADNAMMMIHDPYTMAAGGAEEMRKTADLLDQIRDIIASTYAKRTARSDSEIKQLMADETWMSAGDAAALGFIDAVTEEQRIAACSGFDFSNFRKTPAALTGATQSAQHSMAQVKLAAMSTRLR